MWLLEEPVESEQNQQTNEERISGITNNLGRGIGEGKKLKPVLYFIVTVRKHLHLPACSLTFFHTSDSFPVWKSDRVLWLYSLTSCRK